MVETGNNSSIQAVNTFGPAGLISRNSGGVSTFYTPDERGNVAQRLSSTGAMQSSDLYNAKVGASETLTCTPEHPFFVPGTGWVEAGSLGIGTSIVTRAGPQMAVTALTWQKNKAEELAAGSSGSSFGGYTVYNLTVDGDHTFFVGITGGGTWVHNEECLKTVGRWMHPDELAKMQETGIVQESTSTITHVADPADIEAFRRQAKSGTIYTE